MSPRPLNVTTRPPWTIAAAVTAGLLLAGRLADPAILSLAPLAIPAVIWHRTRRNWLAVNRSIGTLIEFRPRRQSNSIGRPAPRIFKWRTLQTAPAARTRRQILLVRYRKELR